MLSCAIVQGYTHTIRICAVQFYYFSILRSFRVLWTKKQRRRSNRQSKRSLTHANVADVGVTRHELVAVGAAGERYGMENHPRRRRFMIGLRTRNAHA